MKKFGIDVFNLAWSSEKKRDKVYDYLEKAIDDAESDTGLTKVDFEDEQKTIVQIKNKSKKLPK